MRIQLTIRSSIQSNEGRDRRDLVREGLESDSGRVMVREEVVDDLQREVDII